MANLVHFQVLKDFNRREEDFATLDEYNDYLELVETLVFNMTHGIDLDATNKRIEKYRSAKPVALDVLVTQ